MPKPQIISNPLDAHISVTDYRLGTDVVGADLPYGQVTEVFQASATITKGQAVMSVGTAAAGTPTLRVAPVATAGPGHRFVGIAKEGAAAGEPVEVVREGFALADVLNGAAVDAGLTFSGATAGRLIAATVDATLIVGAYFGRTLVASATPPALTPIFVEHM